MCSPTESIENAVRNVKWCSSAKLLTSKCLSNERRVGKNNRENRAQLQTKYISIPFRELAQTFVWFCGIQKRQVADVRKMISPRTGRDALTHSLHFNEKDEREEQKTCENDEEK